MVSIRTQKRHEFRDKLLDRGVELVAGVDEVGAGSWAGPLVVAAVVCKVDWHHDQVRDSKKVTDWTKREKIVREILVPPNIVDCWISSFEASEFTRSRNLGKLKMLAMTQVIGYALHNYPKAAVVVDGVEMPHVPSGVELHMMPKADDIVPAVSAASLIAKVFRDNIMYEYAKQYPGYDFENNVGYGTLKHIEGLRKLGITPIHRKTFRPVRQVLIDGMP